MPEIKMNMKFHSWSSRTGGNFLPLLLLFFAFGSLLGCAPPPAQTGMPDAGDSPELSDEVIRERIMYHVVDDVKEETAAGEPIYWRFAEREPLQLTVVERKVEGERAEVLLDVVTATAPKARQPRNLKGQIRTYWQLKTGWVLRRWEVVGIDNVSFKYKDAPKPPA